MNIAGRCVARISKLSGLEIFELDGTMRSFKTGPMTIPDLDYFREEMLSLYGLELPEDLIEI